jgi:geranylgeranyl diphosphate synthase type II
MNPKLIVDTNKSIETFFESKINKTDIPRIKELNKIIKDLIIRGGKRSRPELLFLTLSAYGTKDLEKYINLAVALEIYHQFLLVHDDIIDQDFIRYDGPNVSGYYAKEFAELDKTIPDSLALLAGDAMFSYVYEIIANDNSLVPGIKVEIIKLFSEINEGVVSGQILDSLNVKTLGPTYMTDDLIEIHTLKTSLYSILLPMKLAAIISKLNDNEIEQIEEFSRSFGVYYQLVDDYSDYFKNDSAFDIREKYRDFKQGKISCPYIFTIQKCNKKDRQFIDALFGNKEISINDMERVVEIFKICGSDKLSADLINEYLYKSKELLEKLDIDNDSKLKIDKMISKYKI